MPTGKLNTAKVKGRLLPGMYGDGGGLWLAVGPNSKSWLYRYMLDGKAREMGLGSFDDVGLAEAREIARQWRRRVRIDRVDPIDERRAKEAVRRLAAAKQMTFKECAEAYIKTHATAWKNGKHAWQWSSTLATYVHPIFGNLPVQAIDTDLIVKALMAIWTEKPETASRVRGRIESILGWATASKLRSGDNPARWRDNLDVLLPKRTAKPVHLAALHYDAMGAFMVDLRNRTGVAARALEFAILTAGRTGEVIGARWDEIDLEKKLWTIPAPRMKGGVEHVVPLSGAALAVVKEMAKLRTGDFVFPGGNAYQSLSNMAMLAVLKRMRRGDLTVHGTARSCFRDWAGDRTSFAREVCEAALAHKIGNAAEQAYRRGSALAKRARLMELWAKHCAAPAVETGEVVALANRNRIA